MLRLRTFRVAGAIVAASAAGAAAAEASTPPFTVFAKAGPARTSGTATLEHVRVAHHQGFDRVVFEFGGETPAWSAGYVPRIVKDPSGQIATVAGRAFLHVVFHSTRVDRAAVGTPIVRTPRFPTLQQVEEAGDFEGVVSFGVGLRRRTGFRAFHLSSPGRIVLDVAH
ncbi:MAG: hypothetical protein E6G10_24170 [Actinobacteria bacterium]|nr:MAG: hypothetical protein E6G10_24170 [Actinomycetota bacterium]